MKIISGGQTGADYGGLLAGRALGWETGGFAPKGWRVDRDDPRYDGTNSHLRTFGLVEHESSHYPDRTMANVDMADVTIAFMLRGILSVGTNKTIGYCQTKIWKPAYHISPSIPHRPYLVVEDVSDRNRAADEIRMWLSWHTPKIINIAGHRQETIRQAALRVGRVTDFEAVVRNILVKALKEA